jgi:hypothetical protein
VSAIDGRLCMILGTDNGFEQSNYDIGECDREKVNISITALLSGAD